MTYCCGIINIIWNEIYPTQRKGKVKINWNATDILSAQKVNFVSHHFLTPDSTPHPILSYSLPKILAQEIV